MYSEQQKIAYQSIQAPADLRDQVLSACEAATYRRPWYIGRPMKLAMSMSAMLVFGFVGASLWQNDQNTLTIQASGPLTSDGSVQIVTAQDEEPDLARFATDFSVTLELELPTESEIVISDGQVALQDSASTPILTPGTVYSAKDDIALIWTVSVEETEYTMTISGEDTTYIIPLTFDAETNSWNIRCFEN